MKETYKADLIDKKKRLQEILAIEEWNKDEVYEEGTWQDELSWEYGMLIDDICEIESIISNDQFVK